MSILSTLDLSNLLHEFRRIGLSFPLHLKYYSVPTHMSEKGLLRGKEICTGPPISYDTGSKRGGRTTRLHYSGHGGDV